MKFISVRHHHGRIPQAMARFADGPNPRLLFDCPIDPRCITESIEFQQRQVHITNLILTQYIGFNVIKTSCRLSVRVAFHSN